MIAVDPDFTGGSFALHEQEPGLFSTRLVWPPNPEPVSGTGREGGSHCRWQRNTSRTRMSRWQVRDSPDPSRILTFAALRGGSIQSCSYTLLPRTTSDCADACSSRSTNRRGRHRPVRPSSSATHSRSRSQESCAPVISTMRSKPFRTASGDNRRTVAMRITNRIFVPPGADAGDVVFAPPHPFRNSFPSWSFLHTTRG